MKSKSERWKLKRIGTMSFINDECDNVKQSDKSFFANIIKNIYLEVIADFKELEGTIEKMKEISLQKEEVVNGITSADYPNDNETEVHKVLAEVFEGRKFYTMTTNCCKFPVNNGENYCPRCGRKIKK